MQDRSSMPTVRHHCSTSCSIRYNFREAPIVDILSMESLPRSRDLQARSTASACDRQVRQRFTQILMSRRQVPFEASESLLCCCSTTRISVFYHPMYSAQQQSLFCSILPVFASSKPTSIPILYLTFALSIRNRSVSFLLSFFNSHSDYEGWHGTSHDLHDRSNRYC